MGGTQLSGWRKIRTASLTLLVGAILLWAGVPHSASNLVFDAEPTDIAIHADWELAVISHEKGDKITVLPLDHFERPVSVPVGRAPKGVAVDAGANTGFVCNSKDGTVSVLDLASLQEIGSIRVGGRPGALAVKPFQSEGVVANRQDGTVSVVDSGLSKQKKVIPVGMLPADLAVDPDLNLAVIVDDISQANDTVAVLDLDTYKVVRHIPVGRGPTAVDVDPETHTAVVANERSGSITIIDLQTWEHRDVSVGCRPADVSVSLVTGQALVLCRQDNLLVAVDLGTDRVVRSYPVNRKAIALAVSPFTNRAAVIDTSANSLSLIQLDNPVPELAEVSPAAADVFSVPETVTLRGAKFLKTAKVVAEGGAGYDLVPRFLDHHTLEVDLPEEMRRHPGGYQISVVNPEPAGGASQPVAFVVRNIIEIDIASPENGAGFGTSTIEVSGTAISG